MYLFWLFKLGMTGLLIVAFAYLGLSIFPCLGTFPFSPFFNSIEEMLSEKATIGLF